MNKRDTRIARQAQSGENLTATWIDEDTVKLEVNGKSFTVTTHTDFTATDKAFGGVRYATVFVWRMRRPANQAIEVL